MKPKPSTTLIRRRLQTWFKTNRRDLPWRHTTDPYLIAVSEVMLQQTQVDRVKEKYIAWRRAWPTTKSLADAKLSDVLQAWSGLGYNSRGVRLRAAAQKVMNEFGGRWPTSIEALESLPGIGPYTARAIASFSRNADEAVIDTNVRRVIGRIFHGTHTVDQKKLEDEVKNILPKGDSANWNATLMDFGSAICTSRAPKCDICPVQQYCRAYPAVLTAEKVQNKVSVKFQETDRYWRGEIVRQLLKHGVWTTTMLTRSLQKLGQVDNQRVVRLINALMRDGVVAISGKKITLAS